MVGRSFVLYDFDGVIADTFHIAHAVAQKTCVYLTEHEYRKRFEGNIYQTTRDFFSEDHGDQCDHDLDWWATYLPGFNTHAKPFEGMPEVLRDLSSKHPSFIVSSSREKFIEVFLEKFGLKDCISGIYGLESGENKNEKLETLCQTHGADPKQCIFITDTLGDVNEATGVGIRSIGVTWGFQDRETLARGEPFAIIDSPKEISAIVERYFTL